MVYAAVHLAMQKIQRLLLLQSKILLPYLEIKSIFRELCSMESILQDYANMQGSKLRFDPLEQRIEAEADKIEDLIESYLSSQTKSPRSENGSETTCKSFSQDLLKVNHEICSLSEKLMQRKDDYDNMDEEGGQGTADYAALLGDNKLVGLDGEVQKLVEWVTNPASDYYIMSVVGMVGIGKTTLAREIYRHPYIETYFDCRFWVTIGPNYEFQQFMRDLLDHEYFHIDERSGELQNKEPGDFLYQSLFKKRYLIVLDDVWSIQVWNDIRRFLPNPGKRCRIILTTRLTNVARDVWTGRVYDKCFLDDEQSWDLLRGTIFTTPGERCSYELEKFGKKIAKNCEGLPMAILAVGNHLRVAEKTVEYWKEVSEHDNLLDILKDEYENILWPLFLSYKMLSRRLKECFLYIGVDPNYKIPVSKLIKLWDAEGFLIPRENESVEDRAEEYIQDLISQSVVLECSPSYKIGKIKACRIHFAFRSLCVTEAQKETFCYVIKKYAYSFPLGTNWQQRLCIHNNVVLAIKEVYDTMDSISSVRSLLCLGPQHQYPLELHFDFRLLKILHALSIRFYEFPHQVLKLVRLRYFALTYDRKLPKSILQLQNLEVLIVGRHHRLIPFDAPARLPVEIWNLKWLKHLQCMGIDLSDPCDGVEACGDGDLVLKQLLTLTGVSSRSCTEEVLAGMPNLKKLVILMELKLGQIETFSFLVHVQQQLHLLESLRCIVVGLNTHVAPPFLIFPSTLRKLTLSGCGFPWTCMEAITCLPNLEVLKLRCYSFRGSVWEMSEEFHQLKVLLLEDLDIEEWIADEYHFPNLVHLIVRHCYKFRSIPLDIGNITTLDMIALEDCNASLVDLVEQIMDKQVRYYGNNHLQVQIHSSWKDR